jgi:thymidylate synthase (FAD)
MVNLVIGVKTTRDIGRQILRHRSFCFQEFSQRYSQADEFVHRKARRQDEKNRQNSIDDMSEEVQQRWVTRQNELLDDANRIYQWALDSGIAKEQARAVLPEGLTVSTMFINGSLRSWIHYCLLRMAPGTQKEHQQIAKKIWDLLLEQFTFLSEIELEYDISQLDNKEVVKCKTYTNSTSTNQDTPDTYQNKVGENIGMRLYNGISHFCKNISNKILNTKYHQN